MGEAQKQQSPESPEGSYTPPPGRRVIKTAKGEALWLASFSDLSLILLCFFIILLSMSTMNQKKAEVAQEAMQQKVDKPKPDTLTEMSKKIEAEIKRLKLEESAHVTFDAAGVAIEFKDGLLFDPGSAVSNARFRPTVEKVMKVIATTPVKYNLRIEGHTDDLPMLGPHYRSNWELASGRGIALLQQFAQKGVKEERISIVSYAHTRPKKPIVGLKGQELIAARASNRRVVIRIEPK
jgi:chemotaxis protein MotB